MASPFDRYGLSQQQSPLVETISKPGEAMNVEFVKFGLLVAA